MKVILGILIIVCIFAIVSLLLLSFSTSMIKNIEEEEDNENIDLNICDYCNDKNHCDKCIYREEEDKNN